MATFEDDFTVSSDTDLGDHTPTTAGTGWGWAGTSGSSTVSIDATADALENSAVTTWEAGYHAIEPDLGDADHQAWGRRYAFETYGNERTLHPAIRMSDEQNCYGIDHHGTGSSGLRFLKLEANAITSFESVQGATGEWLRIKAEGNTISCWKAASGAEPSDPGEDTNWTQVGSDHAGETFNNSVTACGISSNGSSSTSRTLQNFRADVYPVAGGTTYNRTSADTFTTADADTRTATFARDIAEALALVDAATRDATFARSLNEALTVVDASGQSVDSAGDLNRDVAEALTFTDASTRAVVYERLIAESLVFIDASSSTGGQEIEVATKGGQSMTLRQMRRLEREQLLAMIREDDDVIIALVTQLLSKGRNLQ